MSRFHVEVYIKGVMLLFENADFRTCFANSLFLSILEVS